jgi:hypothetical protein
MGAVQILVDSRTLTVSTGSAEGANYRTPAVSTVSAGGANGGSSMVGLVVGSMVGSSTGVFDVGFGAVIGSMVSIASTSDSERWASLSTGREWRGGLAMTMGVTFKTWVVGSPPHTPVI